MNSGLYAKHRGIALGLAKDWHLPGGDADDVRQEALIGLWIATQKWNRDRGSFPPFARLVIQRRLTSLLRSALRERNNVLTSSKRVCGDEIEIVDTLAGPDLERIVTTRETLTRLCAAVSLLSDLEREALSAHLNGDGVYSVKSLDNALARARAKLRAATA